MSFDVFAIARQSPDAVAVVTCSGEVTYSELAARCESAARKLAHLELLEPGCPLAVIVRPTLESVTALFTCMARKVPVLVLNPRLPAPERFELALRAGARAIVEPDAGSEPLPSAVKTPAVRAETGPTTPLALVATSGSTGRPKLVVLSRGAFEASARASAANLPLAAGDRWLLCLPPSHVGGLSVLTRSLLSGSAVCVFDPGERGLLRSAGELASTLEQSQATVASLVPTVLRALLDLPDFEPPRALRAVLLGGAATTLDLLERARRRSVPLLVSYGLTEACSQVTTTPFGSFPRVRDGLVSSGRPLPGVELRVRADDRICVRGPTLASRLHDEPLPRDAEGFFVTDDLGRLDERGELFVYGRASERIVSGGENVDPVAVEAALLQDPSVLAACVFGVPDERFGELVACALVVSSDFEPARCVRRLEGALAPEARPRRAALLDAFPELSSGKLDRAGTRARALSALTPWDSLTPRAG